MASPYIYLKKENFNKHLGNKVQDIFKKQSDKALDYYMKRLDENFASQIGENLSNTTKILNDMGDFLSKSLDKDIQLSEYREKVFSGQNSQNLATNLNNLLKGLSDLMEEFGKTDPVKIIKMKGIKQALLGKTGDKYTYSVWQTLENAILKSDQIISLDKKDMKTAEGMVNRLEVYYNFLDHYLRNMKGNVSDNEKIFQRIKNSISGTLSLYEGILLEKKTEEIVNGMADTVVKNLGSGKFFANKDISEGYSFNKDIGANLRNTTDIALDFIKTTDNGNGTTSITINIPGISSKRYHINKNFSSTQYAHISTLTGRTFNSALAQLNSTIARIDDSELKMFYNILAHRPATDNSFQNAKNNFLKAYSAFAIAGNLSKKDTVYFFQVNNKLFTIPKILKEIKNNGQNFKMMESNFFKGQSFWVKYNEKVEPPKANSFEAGKKRSADFINAVDSRELEIKLYLLGKNLLS